MFYFENVSSTTESISFKVNEYDPDEAAKFISYELYLNGEKVAESFNYEEASFNDLLANKDYYLRVNYECDMNDLSQPYTNYAEYYVHTLELFAPVVTLNNQLATQNAITGQIIINDVSKINNLLYVNLYKDGVLVETSESLDLNYTNLDHNTKYTIVVVHQYDLRDGNGLVTKEVSFDVTTHPIYSLTGTEILNTSAIVEGELVYIHAEVDNPSNATFKKIYINDKEYEVDPASTSTHVFAYIPSVELGETEFTVNKLIATIDGSDFEYYAENNNTATATVYNKLSIDSIEYVDKDFNVRNYFFEDEERYIKFNLVNPNGYSLTSVKFNEFEYKAEDLIYIDDNTYYAAFTYGYSDSHYRPTMNSFSYADSVVSRTTQTSLKAENVYILSNGFEKTYISSAEDLLAIADDYNNIWGYRYYELTQDIDLSGMEWIPVHIRGVLNGNGYSIKNMRIAKTYENSRADIGLISNLEGVLCNLTLDSSIIMVEFKDQPNDTSYVGGLVAHSYYSVIDTCHVLNNSSLSVNNTNSSRSGIDLGGLTGYAYYCDIKNSSNRSNISIKGYVASVGTIVGNSWYSYFVNVFNTGNLSYNNKSENILFCSESNTVVNCYNTGLLNGNNDVSLFNNYNTSKNCINLAKKYPNQVIDFENVKTYTLETNGGNSLSSVEGVIVTLPTPTKEGYYFLGWYENEEFDGKPNSGVYFNNEDITLYAKWAKIIDFSSEMITNDTNHPFEFRNGVLTSTIHERTEYADYTYASYEIKADRNIRVYFKTENLSSSASHSSYWDEEKQLNYVDLSAGEYIKFEIWNYNEDRYAGYVYDLVILEM